MLAHEARETLRSLGVTLDPGHGSVEELREIINQETRQHRNGSGRLRFSIESQCLRKRGYHTPEAAEKAARRLGKPEVSSYRCWSCGSYHNGKAPRA